MPVVSVGAVIGKGGQKIRFLSEETQVKIHIHNDDDDDSPIQNDGSNDRLISIYGQRHDCLDACKEIMKLVQYDADSKQIPRFENPLDFFLGSFVNVY